MNITPTGTGYTQPVRTEDPSDVNAAAVPADLAIQTGHAPLTMTPEATANRLAQFRAHGLPEPSAPAADAPAIVRFADTAAPARLDMLLVAQTLFACSQEMKSALNETKLAETMQAYQAQLKEADLEESAAQKNLCVSLVTNVVSVGMGSFQGVSAFKQLKAIKTMEKSEAATQAAKQAQKAAADDVAKAAGAQNAKANRLAGQVDPENKDFTDDMISQAQAREKSNAAQTAADEAAEEAARHAANSRADIKSSLKNARTQAIVGLGNALAGTGAAFAKYVADLDQAEAKKWAAEATLHTAQKDQTEAAEQKANDLIRAMLSAVQETKQTLNNTEQQIGRNFA